MGKARGMGEEMEGDMVDGRAWMGQMRAGQQ